MRKAAIYIFAMFVVFAGSRVFSQEVIDDQPFRQAAEIQSELKNLARKLAPSVICVQALPDPTSLNVGRQRGQGSGSGVIIDPSGLALSNFHVTDYSPIAVGMTDGKLHDAIIIAYDETADIALLKIKGGPFPAVELGDSDEVRVGDITVAMGNPFSLAVDFKPTTTFGILSGTNRYLDGIGNGHTLIYSGILQTDTPINPGNSGGPLFDREGKLIGINGRIALASERKVNAGVGYAIPISMIKKFLKDMKEGKHAVHGVLGVRCSDGDSLVVEEVVKGSPADKVGIQAKDKIIKVNGKVVQDMFDFIHLINGSPAGTILQLEVQRIQKNLEEKSVQFEVVLGSRYIPERLERAATSTPMTIIDLSDLDPVKLETRNLASILKRVRDINVDPLDKIFHKSGLVRTAKIRQDAMEGKFNPFSRGYVTSDVIEIFKGPDHYFKKQQDHGMQVNGVMLSSIFGDSAWQNGDRIGAYSLKKSDIERKLIARQRRLCFYGVQSSESWSIELGEDTVKVGSYVCDVLTTTWNGKYVERHYVDSKTGVLVLEESIESNDVVRRRRRITKHAKILDRICAHTWVEEDAHGNMFGETRVIKIAYDIDVDPLLFYHQPTRFF